MEITTTEVSGGQPEPGTWKAMKKEEDEAQGAVGDYFWDLEQILLQKFTL